MPHGANIINNKQNGTKSNEQNGKFFLKLSFLNPNTLGFKKSKTKSMDLKDEKG